MWYNKKIIIYIFILLLIIDCSHFFLLKNIVPDNQNYSINYNKQIRTKEEKEKIYIEKNKIEEQKKECFSLYKQNIQNQNFNKEILYCK